MDARRSAVGLTHRQLEVLVLVSDGFSNREIAGRLGVSEGCVKFHVAALLRHYGVDSRVSVAVRATAEGTVQPDRRARTPA